MRPGHESIGFHEIKNSPSYALSEHAIEFVRVTDIPASTHQSLYYIVECTLMVVSIDGQQELQEDYNPVVTPRL